MHYQKNVKCTLICIPQYPSLPMRLLKVGLGLIEIPIGIVKDNNSRAAVSYKQPIQCSVRPRTTYRLRYEVYGSSSGAVTLGISLHTLRYPLICVFLKATLYTNLNSKAFISSNIQDSYFSVKNFRMYAILNDPLRMRKRYIINSRVY